MVTKQNMVLRTKPGEKYVPEMQKLPWKGGTERKFQKIPYITGNATTSALKAAAGGASTVRKNIVNTTPTTSAPRRAKSTTPTTSTARKAKSVTPTHTIKKSGTSGTGSVVRGAPVGTLKQKAKHPATSSAPIKSGAINNKPVAAKTRKIY